MNYNNMPFFEDAFLDLCFRLDTALPDDGSTKVPFDDCEMSGNRMSLSELDRELDETHIRNELLHENERV